jgi:flagellar hook-basal body complex protein FliE
MADFSIQPFPPEIPAYKPGVKIPGLEPLKPLPEGVQEGKEISFRESIRNFVHDVDGMQKDASKKITDFIAGDISDVHDVMIAVEKAQTSFQMLMELRNKMLEAYREIKSVTL